MSLNNKTITEQQLPCYVICNSSIVSQNSVLFLSSAPRTCLPFPLPCARNLVPWRPPWYFPAPQRCFKCYGNSKMSFQLNCSKLVWFFSLSSQHCFKVSLSFGMSPSIYAQIILKDAKCVLLQDPLRRALLEDEAAFEEREISWGPLVSEMKAWPTLYLFYSP